MLNIFHWLSLPAFLEKNIVSVKFGWVLFLYSLLQYLSLTLIWPFSAPPGLFSPSILHPSFFSTLLVLTVSNEVFVNSANRSDLRRVNSCRWQHSPNLFILAFMYIFIHVGCRVRRLWTDKPYVWLLTVCPCVFEDHMFWTMICLYSHIPNQFKLIVKRVWANLKRHDCGMSKLKTDLKLKLIFFPSSDRNAWTCCRWKSCGRRCSSD